MDTFYSSIPVLQLNMGLASKNLAQRRINCFVCIESITSDVDLNGMTFQML